MLTTSAEDISTAKQAFTWICWFIFNSSFEDFEKVYTSTNGPSFGHYVEDLFYQARREPASWFLNIDSDLQDAIIAAAIKKYSKR